jgi:hypothetical protein
VIGNVIRHPAPPLRHSMLMPVPPSTIMSSGDLRDRGCIL